MTCSALSSDCYSGFHTGPKSAVSLSGFLLTQPEPLACVQPFALGLSKAKNLQQHALLRPRGRLFCKVEPGAGCSLSILSQSRFPSLGSPSTGNAALASEGSCVPADIPQNRVEWFPPYGRVGCSFWPEHPGSCKAKIQIEQRTSYCLP